MHRTRTLVAILAVMLGGLVADAKTQRPQDVPGEFDYYVLSLSWSPSFCMTPAGKKHPEQCGPGHSFGFVVHGLWPQFAQGGFPSTCSATKEVPRDIVERMMPLMPSEELIEHEWEKHGTCSGLDVEQYFGTAEQAFKNLQIPEVLQAPTKPVAGAVTSIERVFIEANPGLDSSEIAVVCNGKNVSEIRICLDKDLKLRSCGNDVRDSCKTSRAFFPPVRR